MSWFQKEKQQPAFDEQRFWENAGIFSDEKANEASHRTMSLLPELLNRTKFRFEQTLREDGVDWNFPSERSPYLVLRMIQYPLNTNKNLLSYHIRDYDENLSPEQNREAVTQGFRRNHTVNNPLITASGTIPDQNKQIQSQVLILPLGIFPNPTHMLTLIWDHDPIHTFQTRSAKWQLQRIKSEHIEAFNLAFLGVQSTIR
jgi:hypothetical protein